MTEQQDILEQLYFGQIAPWEQHSTASPEMLRLSKQIDEEIQVLRSMLPDEGIAVLEQLLANQSDMECRSGCNGFKAGFRLGTQLIAATLFGGNG